MKTIFKKSPIIAMLAAVFFLSVTGCKKDEAGSLTVTDIDGNIYHTVTLGTQTWMVENLKTTRFNDGSSIPKVVAGDSWKVLTSPACCWYNNDSITYNKDYGLLYNWYAVNTGKLCPKGWHIPSQAEWEALLVYLINTDPGKFNNEEMQIDVVDFLAMYIKEPGITHWKEGSVYTSTDFTGLKALPGGYRDNLSSYYNIEETGYWWTSTSIDAGNAQCYSLYYNSTVVSNFQSNKKKGYSVLCIKD